MNKKRLDRFGKPDIFRSIQRKNANESFSTGSVANIYNTNITSENSFKYEPYGSALKSTQQLSVDFSKFENHTFFNSATAKVSIAFNKFINKYPFDGTLFEIEEFEDKLTGYERYLLDLVPKNTGYLTPSGSVYIEVKNVAGSSFPEYSKKRSGAKILDPNLESFSFESFIAVPNENFLNDMGIFYISGSDIKIEAKINNSSNNFCSASFRIISGSGIYQEDKYINTDSFRKGEFNHLSFVLNREAGSSTLESYVNGKKQTESSPVNLSKINFSDSLYLFKGGTFYDGEHKSYNNLSASIKDVRIYHQARNEKNIKGDYRETVYKNEYLVANFRFNEPTGSYSSNEYVLDTSGNSLHSKITILADSSGGKASLNDIRDTSKYKNPVENENIRRLHILYPDNDNLIELNKKLLSSGYEYDQINPNLITRLVPPHYYEELVFETGNNDEIDPYRKQISGQSIPGSAENVKTNILNVILFSWANIFDEIKMFIDSFGNMIFSDFNDEDIVPDQLIVFAAKHMGVELPPIFTSNTSENLFDSNKVYNTNKFENLPLKKIQSLIWKRILADASYYKKTKGTVESLKSIFRSSGIDPDKMFAFVEKGANTSYLSNKNYDIKSVDIPMINFSGSNKNEVSPLEKRGVASTKPHIVSSELSSSIEGNLTKESWSYEGYYSFPASIESGSIQSLARLQRGKFNTSDFTLGSNGGLLNIVAKKQTTKSLTGSHDTVSAYFTDDLNPVSPRKLSLNNVNIFDGDLWYISFSKKHEDDTLNLSSVTGSEYSLRCYKCGTNSQNYITSSFLTGSSQGIQDGYAERSTLEGPFVIIGSQSLNFSVKKGLYFIEDTHENYEEITSTDFSGKVASVRFWSTFLTERDSISHSNDYKNYGTSDPNLNSMFLTSSFGKIRLHIDGNQPVTSSNNEKIILNDFTQNEKNINKSFKSFARGFEANKTINSYEKFIQFVPGNKIDEINSSNKVRLRSLEKNPDTSLGYQFLAPVYNTIENNQINDDARLSIEMSVARIINEKINNEISDVSFFENILGNQSYDFSLSYSELDFYSNNFFKNLKGEIKIDKLLNVYTWLESSFEEIMRKSLPKKTKFLGMNYVVEPHVLERSKIKMNNEDAFIGSDNNNERKEEKSSIQVFTGDVSLY